MEVDYEELSHDKDLIARLKLFNESVDKIEDIIDKAVGDPEIYDKLSNADKINYNLLMAYSFNSLFWMYLRAEGADPMKNPIRGENDRLKQYMMRAKQITDKKTLMPHLNKDAAKRFVRSSLWEAKHSSAEKSDGKPN